MYLGAKRRYINTLPFLSFFLSRISRAAITTHSTVVHACERCNDRRGTQMAPTSSHFQTQRQLRRALTIRSATSRRFGVFFSDTRIETSRYLAARTESMSVST